MVTVLSSLTSLDYLQLGFLSPRSFPDRASRRPLPSTRSVLPVLTTFVFKGIGEYLERLVAGIDAPKLGRLGITFLDDVIFESSKLIQLISRPPKSSALKKADINIYYYAASINLSPQTSRDGVDVKLEILTDGLEWQLSFLERVCISCLPVLSMLEDLYFYEDLRPDWKDNFDNGLWLELLRLFSAMKNLYLSENVASRVAPALQELVEGRTTEVLPTVLPTLQNIFVRGLGSSGPVQEGIERFVTARQVAGLPIAISRWDMY
jgi:hypothetical protein